MICQDKFGTPYAIDPGQRHMYMYQLQYHTSTEKKTNTITLTVLVGITSEKMMVEQGILHSKQTFWSLVKINAWPYTAPRKK